MKPIIFSLTGPSCAGKTTLEQMMVDRLGFGKLISTTTRPKRSGEVDGENYYYVNELTFEEMKQAGEFIESVQFNGNQYGLSVSEVRRVSSQNKPIVVVVEPNGRKQIEEYTRKHGISYVPVFVNSDTTTIAQRFLERHLFEMSNLEHINDEEEFEFSLTKIMNGSKDRLALMLGMERNWINNAYIFDHYSFVVEQFDEKTEDAVLLEIDKWLQSLIDAG